MTPEQGKTYMCFSSSITEEEAHARYVAKWRHKPEYIFRYMNMLWLGPIPKTEDDDE